MDIVDNIRRGKYKNKLSEYIDKRKKMSLEQRVEQIERNEFDKFYKEMNSISLILNKERMINGRFRS